VSVETYASSPEPSTGGHRHNITFADAIYVALAEHLGAAIPIGDRRLVSGPDASRAGPLPAVTD
jgi:Predicted nucleic acid-binding protein, contains PIN domain